jgi:hypothetical protein
MPATEVPSRTMPVYIHLECLVSYYLKLFWIP